MAGKNKRNNRSSKTDHVLSLLSGGAGAPPAREEPQPRPAAESATAAPQTAAPVAAEKPEADKLSRPQEGQHLIAPILQVEKHNNEALSHTIRDALAQSLEAEAVREEPALAVETALEEPPAEPLPDTAPGAQVSSAFAPDQTPAPEPTLETPVPASEIEAAARKPADGTPAPAVAAGPGPEPAEPSADAVSEPAEPEPAIEPPLEPVVVVEPPAPPETEPETPFAPRETCLPDGSVCLNIMELLVDERLERYVRMFGLCTCPRCMADARALALTRLPAKYVVLDAPAATPMTSLYRARYESMVVAQVIQACKIVMESPRHTL